MDAESRLLDRFFPTAASARLGIAVAGLFLAIGLLAAAKMLWIIESDLYARHSWPQARGEFVSISEGSSAGSGRASRRPRYWVEYIVHFYVSPAQCRTGVTDGGNGPLTVCVGTVRTRS